MGLLHRSNKKRHQTLSLTLIPESKPCEVPRPFRAPSNQASLCPTGTKRKRSSEDDLDSPQEVTSTAHPRKRMCKTNMPTPEDDDSGHQILSLTLIPESKPCEVPGPFHAPTNESSLCPTGTKRKRSSEDDLDSPQEGTSTAHTRKRMCKTNMPTPEDDDSEEEDFQDAITDTEITEHERSKGQEEVHPEQSFIEKYQTLEEYREGSSAPGVYAGIRRADNLPVAVKVIPKKNVWTFKTEMEDGTVVDMPLDVYLLHKLGAGCYSTSCSITPRLLDWYETAEHFELVMERPEPCTDLADYLTKNDMDHKAVKKIFRELVEEANEMVAMGVFHRDIKPRNILVEGRQVLTRARFIDFSCGTSLFPGQAFRTPQGTAKFASPEYFRNEPYSPGPTTVWQLGLVLCSMLKYELPLYSEQRIASNIPFTLPTDIEPELWALLNSCLHKDPSKRIKLDKLVNHPWLEDSSS